MPQLSKDAIRIQLTWRELRRCFERFELRGLVRKTNGQSYAEMTRKPESNEIQIESFRWIAVQQRVGRIQILEIPQEPVEVKRVWRGVEFLRAVDPVEIEPCSVKIIEIGVQFERRDRLGEHRVIKVLSRAG